MGADQLDPQLALSQTVHYPPPCRDCWVWRREPPVYLGYQKCDTYGFWVKRCSKCLEKAVTYDWVLQIPSRLFDAFVGSHPEGFSRASLFAFYMRLIDTGTRV